VEYDRLRLLWPDHLGLARGKYLPREKAEQGTAHCITLFTLGFDREMTPHDHALFWQGLPDCDANFDPDNVRPGWENNTAVVIPDIMREDRPVPLGAPERPQVGPGDGGRRTACTPMVGIELEAYLFEPDGDGRWRPISTPGAYVYGTGMAVDPTGTIDDIMDTAVTGRAPPRVGEQRVRQRPVRADPRLPRGPDRCRRHLPLQGDGTGSRRPHGIHLTYMGKPINGRGGSGTHVNLSIRDDEGRNVLFDESAEDGLSDVARSVMAGLLHHHVGMAADGAPTVNAYKRLQPGSLCGYWANWGYDHRGVTVRVPSARGQGTRIEHRMGDGTVSPHQAIATVLTAGLLGYEKGYELPPVETLDCIERASTDVVVPASLKDALDALEADTDLVEAFGPAFVDGFVTVKRTEWDRYQKWTTDWELNEYFPFL
jgi:glutamine synthetase